MTLALLPLALIQLVRVLTGYYCLQNYVIEQVLKSKLVHIILKEWKVFVHFNLLKLLQCQ